MGNSCLSKMRQVSGGEEKVENNNEKYEEREESRKTFMISKQFDITIQNQKEKKRYQQHGQGTYNITGRSGIDKDLIQSSKIQPEVKKVIEINKFLPFDGGKVLKFNPNKNPTTKRSSITTIIQSQNIQVQKVDKAQMRKQEKIKQEFLDELNPQQLNDSVNNKQINCDHKVKNNEKFAKDGKDNIVVQAEESHIIKCSAIQKSISIKDIIKKTPSEAISNNWVKQIELPMQSLNKKVSAEKKNKRKVFKTKVFSLIISEQNCGQQPPNQNNEHLATSQQNNKLWTRINQMK